MRQLYLLNWRPVVTILSFQCGKVRVNMKRSLGIKSKLEHVIAEVEDNIGDEPQSIEDANALNARQRGFLCGNDVLKSIESGESNEDSIEALDNESFTASNNGNDV